MEAPARSAPQVTPKDVLLIVRKRAWVVALVSVVLVGAAVGFGLAQPPSYEASARLLVGQKPVEDRPTSLGSDIQGLQQATQTVAVAVASRPVAEGVVDDLGLGSKPEALLGSLEVEQMQATQFIQLTYSDPDPDRARAVVNAVGDVAAKRISDSSAGASGIEASVWEYAADPGAPVGPDPLRLGLLALGLGLMLGTGLTFLLEYLDDGWRSPEEVEAISGVPNFGVVPDFAGARKGI